MPTAAIDSDQRIIIGANRKAALYVPRCCKTKRPINTTLAIAITDPVNFKESKIEGRHLNKQLFGLKGQSDDAGNARNSQIELISVLSLLSFKMLS